MHVLITGGTGFIGSRLTERYLAAGHRVTALGQANTPAEAANIARLREAGATVAEVSVTDPAPLAAATAGVDAIIHLAAAQHEMHVPDAHFRAVNVAGTRHVLDAALAGGVSRVVHGSTIGVYGDAAGRITEDTPCRPDNIYGVTKLEGEKLARSYADRLSLVAVRIPEVYGPGDRRLLKLFRAIQGRKFFNVGPGVNLHHPMYVDDLAAALERLAAQSDTRGDVVLLAGPAPISTNDIVSAVAAAVGTAPPGLRVPITPLLALATALELTLRPLGVQPPLHRRRMDFFRKSFSLDTARAAALGISPRVGFRDGARLTAQWYRGAGLL
ncbi:MAG TPA: NAD(P)-dependent oxidoreductase [Gemmatimonadales bacterium]|nr:NAD(P)-dependent oxidoreductase [Gemmatimonadales bacterium]